MARPLQQLDSNPPAKPSPDERVLLIRLPCNPIFPIGPVYLADHLHKRFPELPQRILDLAARRLHLLWLKLVHLGHCH